MPLLVALVSLLGAFSMPGSKMLWCFDAAPRRAAWRAMWSGGGGGILCVGPARRVWVGSAWAPVGVVGTVGRGSRRRCKR